MSTAPTKNTTRRTSSKQPSSSLTGGHGEGFCLGNILKYTQRYGNKEGKNRKDLLKVLHYALIALHVHDLEEKDA